MQILLVILKIISAIVSIGFIIGIVYSVLGIKSLSRESAIKRAQHFSRGEGQPQAATLSPQQQHWNAISAMFHSPDQTSWRVAILDADSMLEDLVTQMGYKGVSFGEKLKDMHRDNIPWLQSAWDVHLLRNKLAHEGSRYPLNQREAYRAFKMYEQIFYGTGYLA